MRMHLRIVVDYSAHDQVVKAQWRGALGCPTDDEKIVSIA
jgi:hypothetical protein